MRVPGLGEKMGRTEPDGDLKPNLGSSSISPVDAVLSVVATGMLTRLFVSLFLHPQRHTLAGCSRQSFHILIKVNLPKALLS